MVYADSQSADHLVTTNASPECGRSQKNQAKMLKRNISSISETTKQISKKI